MDWVGRHARLDRSSHLGLLRLQLRERASGARLRCDRRGPVILSDLYFCASIVFFRRVP